jgi:hypothetical protein
MNAPNAMKVFMWTCNNALPTKANGKKKNSLGSSMPYLWFRGGNYGSYFMELSFGTRYMGYVWSEDTKKLKGRRVYSCCGGSAA